jgi:dihydropyrimidinase
MHAENGPAIEVITEALAEAGHSEPYYHGLSRPAILEGECVNRVIRLAEAADAPVYVVHLSSRDALEEVIRGRDRGAMAFAETCPQYLFLDVSMLDDGWEGAKYVCSPPLRPADHQEDLWRGLVKDDLQAVGTDHCPFDFVGQKDLGRSDFRRIPNGLPGVEERVDLVFQGVVEGRMSRERWVEVVSAAPARLFGLAGRKGAIAPGYDADIVIYDPQRRHTLSASTHHMNVDYSCYEGMEIQGGCDVVMSRGRIIVEDGEWKGDPGHGRFLAREVSRHYLI